MFASTRSTGWAAKAAYGVAGVAAAMLLFLLGGRLMLGALERQLIYFPSRISKDAATPAMPGAAAVEEVWLEADDGTRIHGLRASAPNAFADLLFFHGNAGSLYDRLDNVALLVESGFNVFIIDYHGYGKSEGTPSEGALYEDGRLAYRYLLDEHGVDPARLVLFGRSLGSTVAIELGSTEGSGAIIIESGFTSARDLAAVHYGWLPGMLLRTMTHEFDSISKVPGLRAPVLYVHGDVDAIVPMSQGRRLYETSPEPKELYIIEGAGHNDTLYVGGSDYFRRLVEFVKRYVDASD